MTTRTIQLATPDGPMDLYEAAPATPATAAVVVIQEAFGVNDHIQDVTRRFADQGYLAVAPSLFHRAGGGTASYDDFSKVLPLFEGLTDEGMLGRRRRRPRPHQRPGDRRTSGPAIVGFCMGGRVTFLVALERSLGAAVGFYGGGIVNARFPQFPALAGRTSSLQTPWLGLFGDLDGSIPIADVESLRETLDAEADVAHQVVRYADADHGFHCDVRPSYNPTAAADAWDRTLAWFAEHLDA